MPFAIIKVKKNKFSVINTRTGVIHSKHTSLKKAEAQVRLLYMVDHNKKYFNKLQ